MDTNRKVFGNSSPTTGAELRGIFGRNFNYSASGSLFRFPAQYIEKLKPSCISHRPVEGRSTIPGIHLLDADGIVSPNELIGNFEEKVPSLVSDLLVSFGYQYSSFLSTVRAFHSTGKPLLSTGKCILRLLKEAWVFYLSAIRGSEERLAANIYAYYLASFRQGAGGDIITGEGGIPFACRASPDGYRLYVTFNGARETELKSAYISDKKVFAIKPPASLFEGEAVIPVSAFKSREACLPIAVFHSAKETRIGFVQPFQHLLKDLRSYLSVFREASFQLRKLLNLVKSGDRTFMPAIDGDTLLKGSIVKPSAKSEPIVGFLECLRVRLKAIVEGLFHLLCTTFNIAYSREGDKPCWASLSVSPL